VVSKDDMTIDLSKIEVVVNWERPTNMQEIKSCLGLTGYYSRFMEGFF
jgi:hypothetical protein